MTKRYLGCALILTCLALSGAGQDKIFLINGNKVRGTFQPERSTDTTMFIAIFDKGLHIPYEIIKAARFTKASKLMGAKQVRNKIYPEIPTGWYHRVGLGSLLGSHSYWDNPEFTFHVETITGYKWSNLKNLGLRLSLDNYDDYISLPLAIHYELVATRKYSSPIVMGGMGYGITWLKEGANIQFDKVRGGLHYYASFGYRFLLQNEKNLILRIGGQSQTVVQEVTDPDSMEFYWGVTYQKRIMRRLTLGVDLTF